MKPTHDPAAQAALALARSGDPVGPPVPADIVAHYLPLVLPDGWVEAARSHDGAAYRHPGGMCVIVSFATERDGGIWQHVSVSYAFRLPKWDELRKVKDLFIGRDREAYQVFPAADRYVNQHPYCLHLWSRLDVPGGAVLPDFRRGGSI